MNDLRYSNVLKFYYEIFSFSFVNLSFNYDFAWFSYCDRFINRILDFEVSFLISFDIAFASSFSTSFDEDLDFDLSSSEGAGFLAGFLSSDLPDLEELLESFDLSDLDDF